MTVDFLEGGRWTSFMRLMTLEIIRIKEMRRKTTRRVKRPKSGSEV